MKLIVNADDFGYSRAVNYGIVDAFRFGVVTSTTLMVNMPGTDHAFELAKAYPQLGVGIHLVLTCGKPVSESNKVPSLVTEKRTFHSLQKIGQLANEDDVRRELTAQFEKFLSYGISPTHIDSHHHVHAHEKVLPIVLELASKHNIPVRRFSLELYDGVVSTDNFQHRFYGKDISLEMAIQLIEEMREFKTVEMMCHPAYVDFELLHGSSYVNERVSELSILTDRRLKEYVMENDIQLVSYREVI